MSENSIELFCQDVIRKSRAFSVLLAFGSSADDLPRLRDALAAALLVRGSDAIVASPDEYDAIRLADTPFVLIDGFGGRSTDEVAAVLGRLRNACIEAAGNGRKVILFCDVPLSRLADVDGSSLLLDAKQISLTSQHRVSLARDEGIASTLPAGFKPMYEATGLLCFARASDLKFDVAVKQVIAECVDRLDPDGIELVLQYLEDRMAPLSDREHPNASAILAIIQYLEGSNGDFAELIRAFVDERLHSAPVVDDYDRQAFVELARLERFLRRMVSDYVLANGLKYRDLLPVDLQERVAERSERSRPLGSKVSSGSPLEWLTLTELTELMMGRADIWRSTVGNDALLRLIHRDVAPIRNSIVHFRSVSGSRHSLLLVRKICAEIGAPPL